MRFATVAIALASLLMACNSGGDPAPQPMLQASVGSYALTGETQTALTLLAITPESTTAVSVVVSGPVGWNGGDQAHATVQPGVTTDHVVAAPPVPGVYTVSTTVSGRSYSTTAMFDASSALAPVANIVITEATADHVSVSWDSVPGAVSYEAQLQDVVSGEVVASEAGTDTSATLNVPSRLAGAGLRLAAAGDYRVVVIAKSGAGANSSSDFGEPANRSAGTSVVISIPEVTHDSQSFQGAAGTFNFGDGLDTFIVLYTESAGLTGPLRYEVTGPTGWNGDEAWIVEYARGITWLLRASTPPLSGEYQFTTVIEGVTYTDSFVVDAEQTLAPPDGITVVSSSLSSVTLVWNAVDDAYEYWVHMMHDGASVSQGFGLTGTNSITLDGLALETGQDYTVYISATSEVPERDPDSFTLQINSSETLSEPFQVAAGEDPPLTGAVATTYGAADAVGSSEVLGFVDAAGIASMYVPKTGP